MNLIKLCIDSGRVFSWQERRGERSGLQIETDSFENTFLLSEVLSECIASVSRGVSGHLSQRRLLLCPAVDPGTLCAPDLPLLCDSTWQPVSVAWSAVPWVSVSVPSRRLQRQHTANSFTTPSPRLPCYPLLGACGMPSMSRLSCTESVLGACFPGQEAAWPVGLWAPTLRESKLPYLCPAT